MLAYILCLHHVLSFVLIYTMIKACEIMLVLFDANNKRKLLIVAFYMRQFRPHSFNGKRLHDKRQRTKLALVS